MFSLKTWVRESELVYQDKLLEEGSAGEGGRKGGERAGRRSMI